MNNDFSKYRVYDRERGEYCDPQDVMLAANGEIYEVHYLGNGNLFFEKAEDGRYIVERCTGCRDMHNTPIYDGDVFADGSNTYIVRTKPECGFCAYDVRSRYIIWGDGGLPPDTADPCFGVEVVGNVHDPVYKNCEGVKNE